MVSAEAVPDDTQLVRVHAFCDTSMPKVSVFVLGEVTRDKAELTLSEKPLESVGNVLRQPGTHHMLRVSACFAHTTQLR
eukprot:1573486-Rhodomonas_salina.1